MTTSGRSGWPFDFLAVSAKGRNQVVTTVTVGIPRFSNSMPSWILHVVQDPQLPSPLTMIWQFVASVSKVSLGAGLLLIFFRWMLSLTP